MSITFTTTRRLVSRAAAPAAALALLGAGGAASADAARLNKFPDPPRFGPGYIAHDGWKSLPGPSEGISVGPRGGERIHLWGEGIPSDGDPVVALESPNPFTFNAWECKPHEGEATRARCRLPWDWGMRFHGSMQGDDIALTMPRRGVGIYGHRGDDRIFLAGGNGAGTVLGQDGADQLTGGFDDQALFGGPGDDTMMGGLGRDAMLGGTGVDEVTYRGSSCVVRADLDSERDDGCNGEDRIHGDVENLEGGLASDGLTGNEVANVLSGSGGGDTLQGNAGDDLLAGGKGGDFVWAGADNDWVHGGEGFDLLAGMEGNDRINAADGRADRHVSCGDGRDVVLLDRSDPVAADCERRLYAN